MDAEFLAPGSNTKLTYYQREKSLWEALGKKKTDLQQ